MRSAGSTFLQQLPICLLGLLCSCGVALAQVDQASIVGTVKDSSGAAIPGAQITVTQRETNQTVRKESDEAGNFAVPALRVGSYSVTAGKTGFKNYVQDGIVLQVAQHARVDITLQVGSQSESIEVKADAILTETQTSSLGNVIEGKRVLDIPLNGRNPMELMRLAPGVTFLATAFTSRNFILSTVSIGGGQGSSNAILLDGGALNVPERNEPAVMPNVDAVQEFKVQTNALSAEFGITGGGAINMVSRSGGNRFSGSLYEFLRNSNLDANGWTNNRGGIRKTPLRYNQFGGSIGGPVLLPRYKGRDKTFFFFNYDGYRHRSSPGAQFTHVPTQAERDGDFSKSYIKDPASPAIIPVVLYDPATTRANPAGSGFVRDPFPTTVLPKSRLDPVALKVAPYWPTPNRTAVDLTGTNNYVSNAWMYNDNNQYNLRIDHSFSSSSKLFGRFTRNIQDTTAYSPLFGLDNIAEPTGSLAIRRGHNATAGHTWVMSPAMLNELRLTMSRELVLARTPGSGRNAPQTLGLPSSIPSYIFPNFQVTDMQSIGNRTDQTAVQGKTAWQLNDTWNRIAGRHSLKAGVDLRLHLGNVWQPNPASGTFSFSRGMTGNPQVAVANTGFGMATFLLGATSGGSLANNIASAESWRTYSWFVQDDFKITPRLTLNLGLRYDIIMPLVERYNRYSTFNPAAINPVTGLPGVMQFAGVDIGRSPVMTDFNNIGPRFGFAYDLRGNGRSVVRGGYGILYYDAGRYYSSPGTNGFSVTTPFASALGTNYPAFQLQKGPESLLQPSGSSLGPRTFLGSNVTVREPNTRTPYVQQWNAGLQHQFPFAILLNAAYAGSHSLKQPAGSYNLNDLNPRYASLGLALTDRVPNPLASVIPAGTSLSSSTISRQQSLAAYPAHVGVSVFGPNLGNAIYHSLQASAEKRFSSGLSFLVSYSAAKLLTDNGINLVDFGPGGSLVGCGQNATYNRKACRSVATQDISRNLVASYVYELPFGKGKPWLSRGPAAYVLGGWQTNGIFSVRTGQPLIVTGASNGLADRPNVVANPALDSSQRSLTKWFNTAAFAAPPNFTYGNTPTTLPNVRAPGLASFDFSMFKNFELRERTRLQFRFETFNFFNRVNFSGPNTNFLSAAFGTITSAGDPRRIQLGLKLNF